MVFEPLQGKRFVHITTKRRRVEWATVMQQVAEQWYPQIEKKERRAEEKEDGRKLRRNLSKTVTSYCLHTLHQ